MSKKIALFCLGILISGLTIYSCSKSGGDDPPANNNNNNNNNGGNNNDPNTVNITGMSFAAITVKAGTTVKWTNNDNTAHTVTADDNSFDSGNIPAGGSYSRTFNTAGTINYHCKLHSGMTGKVTVNQ